MNNSNLKLGNQISAARHPAAALLDCLAELENSDSLFPVAINLPVNAWNAWSWLNANQGSSRFAWSDRKSGNLWVGIGEACRVEITDRSNPSKYVAECKAILNGNEQLKFFGGLSFDNDEGWQHFGKGRFVIPRLQLVDDTLTLAVMGRDDIQRAREDIQEAGFECPEYLPNLPATNSKAYLPNADSWQTRIDEALALIRTEAVEKIVLSRKTILQFQEAIDPIALTAKLDESTHDCFVFCFDLGHGSAFVGATPEQLFQRQQNVLISEVIAGTRRRGKTPAEDQRLAEELLGSDKDQREHDIVRKSIRQKLHKFVDHLTVDTQASLLKLARKQHLKSHVQGQLKPNIGDGTLLQRLHPTPAVGGYPTDNAIPEIARIEPFSRGWYAAPIGWIGANDAQFAVGIRSGLIESNTLSLFSGAGIVRGSKPEEEWLEVENKIQDFLSVLGQSERSELD